MRWTASSSMAGQHDDNQGMRYASSWIGCVRKRTLWLTTLAPRPIFLTPDISYCLRVLETALTYCWNWSIFTV